MKQIAIALCFILIFATIGASEDYVVGEGDVLTITVYDNPDLETTARVTGDGAILFPLIGQVYVQGLTIGQISEKISKCLSDGYIVNPQITIFIKEFKSNKATVMGEIKQPGLYELSGRTSMLELISKAGGLTDNAGDKAVVKRTLPNKEEKTITVDLKRLVQKGDATQDVQIMNGDSIFITKAGVFYVTGEVSRPLAYRYEEGTTVIKAITMAGGFTEKASTIRVRIVRKVDGEEKVLKNVDMDLLILPDDVIVVPESFF